MTTLDIYRLFNVLEDGTTLSAELDTYLAGIRGKYELLWIFSDAVMVDRLLYSGSEIIARVFSSDTAVETIFSSDTAVETIFSSDTALGEMSGATQLLEYVRGKSNYLIVGATGGSGNRTVSGLDPAGKYILVGVSSSNATGNQTITAINTIRSGSTRPTTAVTPSNSATADSVIMCTPLIAPFTFTTSNAGGHTWYFGLLRVDV